MPCAVDVAQGRGKVASTWAMKLKCNVHNIMSLSTCTVISTSQYNQRHELDKKLSIELDAYISTVTANSIAIVHISDSGVSLSCAIADPLKE